MKILIIAIIHIAYIFSFNDSSAKPGQTFQDLITGYLKVKDALVADNSSDASVQASSLLELIKTFDSSVLKSEESALWQKYSADLESQAKNISETDNIGLQRKHFSALSTDMYSLLTAFKGNTTDLYYQFCPMANDDEGAYWISENSKIRNPYFGKKMMTCGETKKKIKAQ